MRQAIAAALSSAPAPQRGVGVGAPSNQTITVSQSLTPFQTQPAPAGSVLLVYARGVSTLLGTINGGGTITSPKQMSPIQVNLDGTPGTLKVSWPVGGQMFSAVVQIVGSGAPASPSTPSPLTFPPVTFPPGYKFPAPASPPPVPSGSTIAIAANEQYTITITSTTPLMQPTVSGVQSQLPTYYTLLSAALDASQTVITLVLTSSQAATEPDSTFLNAVGAPGATLTVVDNGPASSANPSQNPSPTPTSAGTVSIVPGDRQTVTVTSPTALTTLPSVASAQSTLNASGSAQTYNVATVSVDPTNTVVTMVVDVYPQPFSNLKNFVEQAANFVAAAMAPSGSTVTVTDNGPSPTVPISAGVSYTITINENAPVSAIPTVSAVQALISSAYSVTSVAQATDTQGNPNPNAITIAMTANPPGGQAQENPLLFAMAVGAPGGSSVSIASTVSPTPQPTPTPPAAPTAPGGNVVLTGGHQYVVTVTEPSPVTSVPTISAVQSALPQGPSGSPALYTVGNVSGQGSAIQITLGVGITVSEQLSTFTNAVGAPPGSTVTIIDLGATQASPPSPPPPSPPVVLPTTTTPTVPPSPSPAAPMVPVSPTTTPPIQHAGTPLPATTSTSNTATVVAVVAGVAVVGGLAWWAYKEGMFK
jgi:hypothetical protein